MKDFFTRYQESHRQYYVVPAIFGILFAFTLVANYKGASLDFGAIQANVLEAGKTSVKYDADLLLERSGSNLIFRIGKDAEDIGMLNFSLLGDPSLFASLTTSDSRVNILGNEPGIFLIKITINASLHAGDIITTLEPRLKGNTSLALIDAGFTSKGNTYSLSTKGE